MKEKVLSTLKSSETDDWLDINVVRPFAYLWALLCARLHISPNAVTIISMFVGAFSALFFMKGSYYYEGAAGLWANIIALLLLLFADVLDCTDGQLARMTGQTSRLGRILDGTAGIVWYIPIYYLLLYRIYLHHDIEFGWFGIPATPENDLIFTIVAAVLLHISGFFSLSGQTRMADYYIQVHLFFLKGDKGSELENSARLKQMYEDTPWKGNAGWKIFLRSYVNYTHLQEKRTPQFQKLMALLRQKYGATENIPTEVRQQFHDKSLPLIKLNGLLTFNFRTAFLALFCLTDLPFEYFLFEVIFMEILCAYIVHRHESACRALCQSLQTSSAD